jgi:hypothetical protein
MELQQRNFNQVYTLEVQVTAGTINNASTPIYFSGYPVLRGKKIKAITFAQNNIGTSVTEYFLTLVNGNGSQLIYNYPMNSLRQNYDNGVTYLSYNRLNLFNLEDIDLLNSYWINPINIAWIITGTLFRLNFYW